MAKDYVQKYLWRDYGQPFHLAWQITLTADEAVPFLAAVCVLITYTQTRTWSLTRQTVIRIVRPIQLPDRDDPNSLSRLSQYEAMSRFLSDTFQRRRRRNSTSSNVNRKTSPLFGIASVVNAALFVTLGVLIPWLLTGGLQTPVVQSRTWEGCRAQEDHLLPNRTSFFETGKTVMSLNFYRVMENYHQCWQIASNSGSGACDRIDGPILDRPLVDLSYRPDACGLTDQECLQNLSEFRVAHPDLTLRDYGLNMPSPLRHSRRLTCTPLELDVFIHDADHGIPNTIPMVNNKRREGGKELRRLDLKNSISTIEQAVHSPNLTIESDWSTSRFECINCEILHEYLQLENGEPMFVVIGSTPTRVASSTVSQHLYGLDHVFAILALDYRSNITALQYQRWGHLSANGFRIIRCQEQHKLCLETFPSTCTQYTHVVDALDEFFVTLLARNDTDMIKETYAFHQLFYKTNTAGHLMETALGPIHPWSDFDGAHWTDEVVKWFQGAFLLTRFNLHASITGRNDQILMYRNHTGDSGPARFLLLEKHLERICQSTLLLHGDYTNINLVGLVLALFSMTLIIIGSYWRELKPGATRATGKVLKAFRGAIFGSREACRRAHMVAEVTIWSATSSILAAVAQVRSSGFPGGQMQDEQEFQIDLSARAS